MEEEELAAHVANPDCATAVVPTGVLPNETESETDRSSQLALQNPVILTNLFQLCPLPQLANLRLVSKEWHQLSLPIWRATLPITFSKDESVITLVPQPRNSRFTYYFESFTHEYLNKPETQTDRYPHRYLKLLHWHYDSTIYSLQRVWDGVGANIHTLELHGCTFPRVDDFRKVIYQSCPNLKKLRIWRCWFRQVPFQEGTLSTLQYVEPEYGERHNLKSLSFMTPLYKDKHRLPVTWLEIFSHFPSMTNFFFGVGTFRFDPEVADEAERFCDTVLNAIDTVRMHDKKALPFKSFTILPDLEIFPTQEKLRLLRKLHIPMEEAMIRLHLEPDMDEQLLTAILQFFGKRLCRLLVIAKKGFQVPVHWKFPCEGVELCNLGSVQLSNVLCEDVTFLEFMPNLQHLEISDAQYQEDEGPFNYVPIQMISNTKLPEEFRLSSLTYFVCDYILTEEDIRKLTRWMPNMEKLELILNDKQFEIVCDHWRNLKGLKVLGGQLTDKGITGRGKGNEAGKGQGEDNCVPPNITYLKRLIYCSIWSNNSLTEASVFSGFLKLPHLRRLQVCPQPGVFAMAAGKLLKKSGSD